MKIGVGVRENAMGNRKGEENDACEEVWERMKSDGRDERNGRVSVR